MFYFKVMTSNFEDYRMRNQQAKLGAQLFELALSQTEPGSDKFKKMIE